MYTIHYLLDTYTNNFYLKKQPVHFYYNKEDDDDKPVF